MASRRPQIETAADIRELLLHSKAPRPLTPEQVAELERISKYDVSNYSEEDVRAEIIDPVIRVLGYAKETYFSTQREKHLKVADGDLFIDYRMTLWSQAFWIIEAKRVKRKPLKFTSEELRQALLYAVHPEIDAALVVLCDGRVFEVYDRDESVTQPAARVEVKKLPEQFHMLQALLGPWQAWFFQKRRALRLASRVLQVEMTPGRIEEFSDAMQQRMQDARAKVYDNWRKVNLATDEDARRHGVLEKASIKDIVATEFFSSQTAAGLGVVARSLVDKAKPGAFELMYAMFPDHPGNLNDHYVAQALRTLIEFSKTGREASWIPGWLGAHNPVAILRRRSRNLLHFRSRLFWLRQSSGQCSSLLPAHADFLRFRWRSSRRYRSWGTSDTSMCVTFLTNSTMHSSCRHRRDTTSGSSTCTRIYSPSGSCTSAQASSSLATAST
jgi:Type I restriction enzyme R protein N terminus (HSDR_N)